MKELDNYPYYSVRRIPYTNNRDAQGYIYAEYTKEQRLKEVVLYKEGGASIILTDMKEERRVYSKAFINMITGKGENFCTQERFAAAQASALHRILGQNSRKSSIKEVVEQKQ